MYKNRSYKRYTGYTCDDIQTSVIVSKHDHSTPEATASGFKWMNFITLFITLLFVSSAGAVTVENNVEGGDSSAVSSFWTSVASSAASDVGGVVAGYALSALGLSVPSQEDADLSEIINLLTEIDAELTVLVDEVQALQCLTAQDQTTLTNSIKNIQGLYDTYSDWVNGSPTVPCWEQSDDSGNVCFGQTGVKTWLNEVMDPENGVNADLDAINDVMIQAGNTGVIYTCVKTITTNYNNSDGPKKYVFDWTGDSNNPGYYDQVQSLTDYYYGVQAQGAALLSEASHLQACLSLGVSECQFTGQTSDDAIEPANLDATPSNPGDICANAQTGSIALEDCTDAQNSVVKIYGYIKAQLIQAGAPYTNSLAGLNWGSEIVYPKSLEDFTNKATVNGKTISDCSTPLSSASPCGFTVGSWNQAFPSHINYAGYDIWRRASGTDLNTLLSTYNNKTSGTTSGSLGTWMNSVGFTTTQNKIVLTPQDGNGWGTTTVCFMDTSIARSSSKQPWCDGHGETTGALSKQGNSGSCGGACYFANYSQANFTGSSIRSDFYPMSGTEYNDYGISYEWKTKPGWLTEEQGNSKFHHFRWGAFDLGSLPTCTVRTVGDKPSSSLNPGGIHSMCGSDLQAWLDLELPEPQVPAATLPILITPDLHMHIHSFVALGAEGQQSNIWAYLNYVGNDRNGVMVWKLMRWGQEYEVPRLAPTYGSISQDLRIEIESAIYQGGDGDQELWANLYYSGENASGDQFWTLEEFGFY